MTKKLKRRYNWEALRYEFLQGKWDTVEKFKKDKKLPTNPNTSKRMKGWTKEK